MADLTNNILLITGVSGLAMIIVQFVLALLMIVVLRVSARERAEMNKEIFGLVKRIEGLTAQRREQMLQHYDRMLESLANRLPIMVAGEASSRIVETETQILHRLTELDPAIRHDETQSRRLDELVRSLEGLEDKLVTITSDAVKQIMLEGRRELLEDEAFFGMSKAA